MEQRNKKNSDGRLADSNSQGNGKLKISISPFYFSILTAMSILDTTNILLLSLLSSLAHESAHVIMGWLLGSINICFEFKIPAMTIKRGSALQLGYMQEALISSAGPLINLIIAVLLNIVFGLSAASVINYALFLINSLPVRTLDGGNVLFCLLSLKLNPITAEKTVKAISYAVVIPILLSGIIVLLVTGKNFSLLAIGVFLLVSLISGKN